MPEPASYQFHPHELKLLPSTPGQATATLLTAALAHARRGTPVFPCQPGGKAPLTPRGHKAATTDPEQIKRWWTRWPAANIGIPTGERSGLLVLDVDEDKDGFEGLASLTSSLPDTYAVRTGGGGAHFYFRYPPGSNIRNSADKIAPGVDVRGEGGYVIAPPSRTTAPYAVVDDQPLAGIPEWLSEPLRSHPRASVSPLPRQKLPITAKGGATLPEVLPEGARNHGLTRIAGSLRARGHDDAHLFSALERINEDQCAPPLPAPEVHKIARSVCRYPVGVPTAQGPAPEVLEALEGVEAGLWERSWRGMGGKTDRDMMVSLLKLARRHGEIIPAGVRVEVSYRDLALLAAVSKPTIWKAIRRMKKAGLLRADNLGRLPEEAGAFVLLAAPGGAGARGAAHQLTTPSTAAPQLKVGVEGVVNLSAPRLRWSAPGVRRMGKSAGQVVDTLEAAGVSLTLEDLADRTGCKRPRDLRRRTLPRLVEAGVVVVEAGVVALTGDWREAIEVERERAGENAAHRRDADRYQRERDAYRRRDETDSEAVPPPLRALCELERVGVEVEEKDGEPASPKPPVEGRGRNGRGSMHNTPCEGDHGPALADAERTGGTQERSVDSGHGETETSGQARARGERESGQEREREAWPAAATAKRLVPTEQR